MATDASGERPLDPGVKLILGESRDLRVERRTDRQRADQKRRRADDERQPADAAWREERRPADARDARIERTLVAWATGRLAQGNGADPSPAG